MVTTMNACLGSWKCGKGFAFNTFLQPLFLFFEQEFPEKVTMKGGGNGNKLLNPLYRCIMKAFSSKLLTLLCINIGGIS
jgi:hypothetical protein